VVVINSPILPAWLPAAFGGRAAIQTRLARRTRIARLWRVRRARQVTKRTRIAHRRAVSNGLVAWPPSAANGHRPTPATELCFASLVTKYRPEGTRSEVKGLRPTPGNRHWCWPKAIRRRRRPSEPAELRGLYSQSLPDEGGG
jgi:hypothetical protein